MRQNLRFKPRKDIKHGKAIWRIAHRYEERGDGKRTAKYLEFNSEEEAFAKQKELLILQAQGDDLSREAFDLANKFTIAACVEELAKVGATVRDATDYYLKTRFAKKGVVSAKEAARAYLSDKTKEGIEASTKKSYTERVNKFVEHFDDKPIAEITKADLEKYFDKTGQYSNNNTKRQNKRWLISMFNWLVEQDYIALPYGTKNEAQKMAVPNPEKKTPRLATWQSVYDLLYWLDQRGKQTGGRRREQTYDTLFYFCCCLFLGLRMKEAYQITWDDVLWETREITVLVEESKTDKRRVNKMPDNVWQWIKYLHGKAVLNTEGDASRRVGRIISHYREHLKSRNKMIPDLVAVEKSPNLKARFKEKFHNIRRTTFCGNHLRLHNNDTAKTAALMGNSPRQVESNYKQLVKHRQDAIMFFSIRPPVVPDDSEFEVESSIDEAVNAYLNIDRIKPMLGEHGTKYVDKGLTDCMKYYEDIVYNYLHVKMSNDDGTESTFYSNDRQEELHKALSWETSPVGGGDGVQIKIFETDEDFAKDDKNEEMIAKNLNELKWRRISNEPNPKA